MILSDIHLDKFIAIDVETTGLDLYNDKIIEISAVKFKNGKIIDQFTSFINPSKKIPSFIEKLTGISNDDVLDAPRFDEISNDLVDFIGNSPIVGHNIKFDIDFINSELKGLFDLYNCNLICDTYYLSKIFLYDIHSYKLESLCNHFNININNSHRAEDDAINTGYLFLKILNIIFCSSIDDYNTLLKIYSDNMVINKKLFIHLIDFCLTKSIKCIDPQSYDDTSKVSFSYSNNADLDNNYTIDRIYQKGGVFDNKLEKYEYRESQYKFALEFENAILNNEISVIEAETGLGKTYGYLIPSLLAENKKIIISTSTHNLQEQLFNSDIPCLGKILDIPIYATMIKGMNNYICNYRLADLINNIDFLTDEDRYELMTLVVWSNKTLTGDISECNSFKIWKYKKIWDLVCFEYEYCNLHNNNNKCFYSKLKTHINSSNILVINHSLLASCHDKEESIIDDANICIIDEAHKLSENCQMHLKESLNKNYIKGAFDSLFFSSSKLLDQNRSNQNFNNLFNQLNNFRDKSLYFLQSFERMSLSFAEMKISTNKKEGNHINDVRYKCTNEEFINISPSISYIIDDFSYLYSLICDFRQLMDQSGLVFSNKLNKINYSISFNKINEINDLINKLFDESEFLTYVHWLSISLYKDKIKFVTFNRAPLNVNTIFRNIINQFDSTLLTSATLTVNDNFDYILDDLGLNSSYTDKNFRTCKFQSPFMINDQLKLFISNNYNDINSREYIESIYELVVEISSKMKKRMLVLCTSYKQIKQLKNMFNNYQLNKNLFFQDSLSSRQTLLKQYLLFEDSILFGTASFWEGVDLPHDKLEILIIVKMPFSNPYNPIVQAKIDTFINRNMDPFKNYQLSEAILKLKQGIGRLIRKNEDKGVCIITDPRILKRNYGEVVLDSLPVEATYYKFSTTVVNQSENFLGT